MSTPVQKVAAGERVRHIESSLLTKAGHRFHLSSTISPLSDSAGVIVGTANIIRDMSEHSLNQVAKIQ